MFSKFTVLVRIAVANIFASALNLFVGLVLAFGAAMLVIGGSIFWTLDEALSKSIVGSISGHLQVYGGRSKDALELYGKVDGSDSQLTPIDDFKGLKAKLLKVPNVARVVPMGNTTALISSGNIVDVTIEKLRVLIREQGQPATKRPDDDYARQRTSLEDHLRTMVTVLAKDLEREKELTAEKDLDVSAREVLAKAGSDEFWKSFEGDAFGHLEWLENQLAPVVSDAEILPVGCLGTDLDAYQQTFDRLSVVEGALVPTGHRGILLPRFLMEEALKLKNARRLDKIRDARAAGRKLSNLSDQELQRFVKENQVQTREIVLQLDSIGTEQAVTKLQGLLHSDEHDLATLLTSFFTVTDENFDQRYRFFYEQLAPQLALYRVKVGDTLTLKSLGRSGGQQSALVRLTGVFEFKGLEKSPLAGAKALIDLITFRELYGYLTPEKKAELDAMKAQTGAKEVTRENAEADLFSGDDAVEQQVQAHPVAEVELATHHENGKSRLLAETFDPAQLDDGVVLDAAILLADGSPLAQLRAQAAVEQLISAGLPAVDEPTLAAARTLSKTTSLPLGLSSALSSVIDLETHRQQGQVEPRFSALLALKDALKAERPTLEAGTITTIEHLFEAARPPTWVVGWTQAAGFLGKFIDFFRLLLVAVVGAFAFFALIVVTIGMTISTLQRTSTIGTMRAIGAQRPFVVAMVLVETIMLGLSFGVIGAGLGALAVKYLHDTGIPAFKDELYFFFSGPVLRPELTVAGLVLAVIVTLVASVLAVIFPLVLATRISPLTAMQSTE
jgi:ABC-type lipoprotein release transport system permease subunit